MWRELSDLKSSTPLSSSAWLVIGDFNQILNAGEHYSIQAYDTPIRGMDDLRSFLQTNDLTDLSSRGTYYTWTNCRPEDPILRKLDRAVVNSEWNSQFPESLATFDPPGDSDHSPCLISLSPVPHSGKKSFKYFSFVSTHSEFLPRLRAAWGESVGIGSKLFTLGQRLKKAKDCCKKINRDGFGNIQHRTKTALEDLGRVQAALLNAPTEALVAKESAARDVWTFFASAQENFFKLKSRIRWLREGDSNTKFFHRVVLANQSWNAIRYIRDASGLRIYNQQQIKGMAVAYFKNLLGSESRGIEPMTVNRIRELHPFRCSLNLATDLTWIPTDDEIKAAFFKMPKCKAPGPDGFPAEFFIEAWEVVGEDSIQAVKEFFTSGRLLGKFNATTVALLPKITGADELSKFRPVSCCSTIYKVVARLLKQRLQLFGPEVVQLNQVGFIKGRLLCENVLLASELVTGFHKRGPATRGCLQIDLVKAYDNLNWDFMLNILSAFDLPEIFINWIKECITTTFFSIAFNGELLDCFHGKKGLRQGDPISSLLFVLAMDILSKMLDKGAMNHVFGLHPLGDAPLITHISFADDVLLFFDGTDQSLQGLLAILEDFNKCSGLGINRSKTAVFFDGGDASRNRTSAAAHGISQGSFPIRYLGVPLTTKKLRRQDYQPLLDKIHSRFSSWTIKHLSFAGRLQLLKSVIYATISFWASIFLLPNRCLKALEQMCNSFLWKGVPTGARGAKVAWDIVCSATKSGGLGLRRLGLWNKIMGLKLIWLLFASSGSLGVSWVRAHLIGAENFWNIDATRSGSWIWKSLCKLRQLARPFVMCEIGSGMSANFWHDNWTSLGPLIHLTGESGPRLTGLQAMAVVRDALVDNRWWISSSRSRNPTICFLKNCLPDHREVISSEADDRFLWKVGDNAPVEGFSSSLMWNHLYGQEPEVNWHKSIWFKGRIPKHAFIS